VSTPAPPAPEKEHRYSLGAVLVAIAIVAFGALVGLYFRGNLDRPLYGIGLNYHECARNGLGATFCGDELTQRRTEQQQAERKSNEEQAKLKEESETRERESNERIKRADEESKALQREATEQQETLLRKSQEEAP
jgi:hypothetical protein